MESKRQIKPTEKSCHNPCFRGNASDLFCLANEKLLKSLKNHSDFETLPNVGMFGKTIVYNYKTEKNFAKADENKTTGCSWCVMFHSKAKESVAPIEKEYWHYFPMYKAFYKNKAPKLAMQTALYKKITSAPDSCFVINDLNNHKPSDEINYAFASKHILGFKDFRDFTSFLTAEYLGKIDGLFSAFFAAIVFFKHNDLTEPNIGIAKNGDDSSYTLYTIDIGFDPKQGESGLSTGLIEDLLKLGEIEEKDKPRMTLRQFYEKHKPSLSKEGSYIGYLEDFYFDDCVYQDEIHDTLRRVLAIKQTDIRCEELSFEVLDSKYLEETQENILTVFKRNNILVSSALSVDDGSSVQKKSVAKSADLETPLLTTPSSKKASSTCVIS